MLTKMYQTDGIEFSRYHHLVAHVLGRSGSIAVSVFQMLNLVLSDIGAPAGQHALLRDRSAEPRVWRWRRRARLTAGWAS